MSTIESASSMTFPRRKDIVLASDLLLILAVLILMVSLNLGIPAAWIGCSPLILGTSLLYAWLVWRNTPKSFITLDSLGLTATKLARRTLKGGKAVLESGKFSVSWDDIAQGEIYRDSATGTITVRTAITAFTFNPIIYQQSHILVSRIEQGAQCTTGTKESLGGKFHPIIATILGTLIGFAFTVSVGYFAAFAASGIPAFSTSPWFYYADFIVGFLSAGIGATAANMYSVKQKMAASIGAGIMLSVIGLVSSLYLSPFSNVPPQFQVARWINYSTFIPIAIWTGLNSYQAAYIPEPLGNPQFTAYAQKLD